MRNAFIHLPIAAALAAGLLFAGSGAPRAESVMGACASQWKQAEAAGTTGGQTWPQFLAGCRTHVSSGFAPAPTPASAPAPAPAPAPQSGSLFPWWQPQAPASPAATQAGEFTTELQAKARCPSDTVVWVNTRSRVYHYSGTHNYGHTRKGAYMCEADARAGGNRPARGRGEAKAPAA